MTHTSFTPSLDAFRFYADGTESGSTALAAQGVAPLIDANANSIIQLRVRVQETGGSGGASTDDWQLQVSKNGGGNQNVTTGLTGGIRAANSTNTTDSAATTNRLTAGSGSFIAGEISEDGLVDDFTLTANNYTEFLYILEVVSADVADNDSFSFTMLLNGATITVTSTPSLTIDKLALITGTLSKTLAAVTGSANGDMPLFGDTSRSVGTIGLSAGGTLPLVGTLTKTLGAITVVAEGGAPSVTGTLTQTLGAITVIAAGVLPLSGTTTATLAAVTSSAAGTLQLVGTTTATLAAITLVATGENASPITGTLAATLNAVTVTSSGALSLAATASNSIGNIGLLAEAGLLIEGDFTKAIGALTLSATGGRPIDATVTRTLDAVILSSIFYVIPKTERIDVHRRRKRRRHLIIRPWRIGW